MVVLALLAPFALLPLLLGMHRFEQRLFGDPVQAPQPLILPAPEPVALAVSLPAGLPAARAGEPAAVAAASG